MSILGSSHSRAKEDNRARSSFASAGVIPTSERGRPFAEAWEPADSWAWWADVVAATDSSRVLTPYKTSRGHLAWEVNFGRSAHLFPASRALRPG